MKIIKTIAGGALNLMPDGEGFFRNLISNSVGRDTGCENIPSSLGK